DMDIWIALNPENAERAADALREFGFHTATGDLFAQPDKIIRMGVPPLRIEVLTSISGVKFSECFARRITPELDGVTAHIISIEDLRVNKLSSGRLKDLADLEELG
ncbi:MAG: hypothetical protein JWO80_672, partial [Bryobacterales bacterium]|nr:hypothetical protein [Bryobacterales bacterium]